MKRYFTLAIFVGAALLANAPSASAQRWGREATPRAGACFYEDINFQGRYFCTRTGDNAQVPGGTNDEISSIRLFGGAEVTIYQDPSFRGTSRVINSDIPDLRRMKFNDRISSYRVDDAGYSYSDRGRVFERDRVFDRDRDDRPGRGNERRRVEANSRYTFREAQDIVRRSYVNVLRREPDPQGMRSWTEQVMANNWTQRDLENQLRRTDEYRNLPRGRR